MARLHLEIGKTTSGYTATTRSANLPDRSLRELFQRERLPYYERLSLLSLAELYTQQDNPTRAIVLLEQIRDTPIPEQKNLETEVYRHCPSL